jgi:hypothetical protein
LDQSFGGAGGIAGVVRFARAASMLSGPAPANTR